MEIETVMSKWLEWAINERRETTITKHYQPFVSAYLESVGNHEIGEYSIHHLDRFIAHLRQKGLNEISTNMKLQRLSTFLHWAKERQYIGEFPKIRKMKEPQKLPRILSLVEVRQLFERIVVLKKNANNAYMGRCYLLHERALMVALATGFRRSEIFYLKWEDIDLGRKIITVRHQPSFMTKEKQEKQAIIPDYLLIYLTKERDASPRENYLLDDQHGEIFYKDPMFLTRAFARHYKALKWGVRKIKPLHGFRALFADRLYHELEIELDVLREMMGHSNERVTRLYLSKTNPRHWKAAKQLNDYDSKFF